MGASLDNHTRDQIAKLMAKEAARKCEEAQKWQAARLERKSNKKPFYKDQGQRHLQQRALQEKALQEHQRMLEDLKAKCRPKIQDLVVIACPTKRVDVRDDDNVSTVASSI